MRSKSDRVELLDRIVRDAYAAGVAGSRAEEHSANGREVQLGGQRLLNFASCSYLGLEIDPRLVEASIDAVRRYGIQLCASRGYLSSPLYAELEARMAAIFGAPVTITPTTTLGHLSAVTSLVDADDAILLDHQVHASVQLACRTVQAEGVRVEIVPHSRLPRIERRVGELAASHRRVWYMADGVHSMTGRLAPVSEIGAILDRHPSMRFYVDDAHGMSWCGARGNGSVLDVLGIHPQLVFTTGLGKGFGTGGGIVLVPDEAERIRVERCGATMVFGGPLQPAVLGAAIAAAGIHLTDEIAELQGALGDRMALRNALAEDLGVVMTSSPDTPVGLVATGSVGAAQALCRRLADDGHFINPAQFPALPVRRSGGRFLLTRHHGEGDIESLMHSISRHWEPALQEGGTSPEEIARTFKVEIPERRRASGTSQRDASSLTLETADSIEKLDAREWDSLMADRGCVAAAALRVFESAFGGDGPPEDQWKFRYYVVRDEGGAPVLATCFTAALWKADMLAEAAASAEIERRRADDPYFLSQRVFAMGCLLSEGNHLWLRDDAAHPRSREALRMLLEVVRDDAIRLDCEMRVVRDVPDEDAALRAALEDAGLLRIPAPEGWQLDDVGRDDDALFTRLSAKQRLHQRRDVAPWNETYDVEVRVGEAARRVDVARLRALYENVRGRSLTLNTYPLPEALFDALLGADDFELTLFRPRGGGDDEIVGFGFGFFGQAAYVPLFLGMDYDYVRDRGLYRQMLRSVVHRARARGRDRVAFGFGADLEKRRFGARGIGSALYVEVDDHYALDAVAQIAAREATTRERD